VKEDRERKIKVRGRKGVAIMVEKQAKKQGEMEFKFLIWEEEEEQQKKEEEVKSHDKCVTFK